MVQGFDAEIDEIIIQILRELRSRSSGTSMADAESNPSSRRPVAPGENPLKGWAVPGRRPALGPFLC
jgi:hypothetical protein